MAHLASSERVGLDARTPAIALDGVCKVYDGTIALATMSHGFERGRVHALIGRNGSGKSTLVKMMSGAVLPTFGSIEVGGKSVLLASPRDAHAAGIVTVHQELSLVPALSVGENIYLGRLPRRRYLGVDVVNWGKVHADAGRLLGEMGLAIDSARPVASLSVGQQQIVEIVKAMSLEPSILMLDEPTSALATREVEQLFDLVRRLRERGVTMVYITHRMNELFEIADTCTVLRDGRHVGSGEMSDATPDSVVEMMFGKVAKAKRPARVAIDHGTAVLRVERLTRENAFRDVSFELHCGEVLGLAGLLGSGRTEILRAVFGADHYDSGIITVNGTPVAGATPQVMKNLGIGYTPENRKEVGLVQMLSSHDNLCVASLGRIGSHGVVTKAMEAPIVSRQIEDLRIKVPDPALPVSSLSGGNQQKVVIGNWLNTQPKVMFFDEPTRGVDVQAKQQIFEIIWQQAARGMAAIFVSSELEEVLEVADRILVIRHGRVVAEVLPEETNLTELYCTCMEGAR